MVQKPARVTTMTCHQALALQLNFKQFCPCDRSVFAAFRPIWDKTRVSPCRSLSVDGACFLDIVECLNHPHHDHGMILGVDLARSLISKYQC